ncbi:hypothetical protein [Croceitalea rosinachiae]|uniref:DinB family protein n=1 Tax=Croceitalea rosinachiae TaxID=3075596 RepID=A0ABU3A892_9FLAO|nr:hypothetical protein [Croceitalea sp. F388]MDT0606394.1 hypothetical protein [Croceitalea sp. F388]
MANLLLTPENQIQRLNLILSKVENLQKLPLNHLIDAPYKSWNTLEVLEHLSIAFSFYDSKIEHALNELKGEASEPWSFKARWWQKFVIEGQRPKNGKRPFKIKTLKRFEPLLQKEQLTSESTKIIFNRFLTSYDSLKSNVLKSRNRHMKHKTFNSAIGPIVSFYLPEAFEFLICHAERHMVQIDKILTSPT